MRAPTRHFDSIFCSAKQSHLSRAGTHTHISAHRALDVFGGDTSGDAQQPQNGVGGAAEGTDPQRRSQEKSRGELKGECTFIAIAGARRGNAPLLFVPGIFKGRCLHAGSEVYVSVTTSS